MVVVRAERENSWALAFQLYFPIALYRQRIDLSSAFFDNDSISYLELLVLYSFRRCPYAIRARMAIAYAGIYVELREISLRNKPEASLAVSLKGTVPVLALPDQSVVDESLDVMLWSLRQNDPDGWVDSDGSISSEAHELTDMNDSQFKVFLDRYKYSVRFPEHPPESYRGHAEKFLGILESRLDGSPYLVGNRVSLADVAVFLFIRQFAKVDLSWFQASSYTALNAWLGKFEQGVLFKDLMKKYKPWNYGEVGVPFGHHAGSMDYSKA